ncbi:hypothetical protein M8J77_012901 [Diaphorina citri]|nr:hypothetical protein M8J77_012901 [Diaphorina citri]
MASGKFNFAIDRGGTFTDVFAICPDGKQCVMKLLSVSPEYPDAPTEGIRRILQQETGRKFQGLIDSSLIGWIRMGTTVATNALLEKKGANVVLVTNKGMKDLLVIGDQSRPKLFELNVTPRECLYQEVLEVDTRLVPCQDDELFNGNAFDSLNGVSGEIFSRNKNIGTIGAGVDTRRRNSNIQLRKFKRKWQEDSVPQRNINPHIPRILFRGETNNQEDLKARRIAPEPGQYTTIYIAQPYGKMIKDPTL